MSTHDTRLDALERRVTSLEVRRLQDESLAKDNAAPEQGRNLREVNENMTILLGVIGKQGQDLRELKERLGAFEQRVEYRFDAVDQRLDRLETKFDDHTALLNQILARLPQ